MWRIWFDGKIVDAVDIGEVDIDADRVKVAQEYQIVYDVAIGSDVKMARPLQLVPRQYDIFDLKPGTPSPLSRAST